MNNDILMLFISFIGLLNTLVLLPIAKFSFYVIKEINYIKGHLNIKD